MRKDEEGLRRCPTCDGPVEDLGLRDYRWLANALPGKVGAADLDFVLEQASTGRVLIMEFKPAGSPSALPMGQRLLLKRFAVLGCDVWVVSGPSTQGHVKAGAMNREGQVPFSEDLTLDELAAQVSEWWSAGLQEAARRREGARPSS